MFRGSLASPIETNLKNLAQQRDFHGNPKDSELEGIMSAQEDKFAPIIEELRRGHLSDAALPFIREFIVHLLIRTKNIRAGFAEASQELFHQIGEALPTSDRKKWKHRIKQAARKELRKPEVRNSLRQLPKAKRTFLQRTALQKIVREIDFR